MKHIKVTLAKMFGWVWVSAVGKVEEQLADAYNWEDEEPNPVPWTHFLEPGTGQVACQDDPWLAESYSIVRAKVSCPACLEILRMDTNIHAVAPGSGGLLCGNEQLDYPQITLLARRVSCPGCRLVLNYPAIRN